MKKGSKHSEESKQKVRIAKLGKKTGKCSEERRENIRAATKGIKKTITNPNPSWFPKGHIPLKPFEKGHKSWNEGKFLTDSRMGKKYKFWRLSVLNRDGNKCAKCSSTYRLHAHHKIPWKDNVDLRFDIDNGQTLCNSCHSKEEGLRPENICKNKQFNKGHKGYKKMNVDP